MNIDENNVRILYPRMQIKLFKIDSNTTEDVVNKWLERTTRQNNIIDIRMQLDSNGCEHILIMYSPKSYDYHDYMVANA